jgi:hypothetical protein
VNWNGAHKKTVTLSAFDSVSAYLVSTPHPHAHEGEAEHGACPGNVTSHRVTPDMHEVIPAHIEHDDDDDADDDDDDDYDYDDE